MNKRGEEQSIYYVEDECEYPLMVPLMWACDANHLCFLLNESVRGNAKFRHTGRLWEHYRIVENDESNNAHAFLCVLRKQTATVERLVDTTFRASRVEACCVLLNKYATEHDYYFAHYISGGAKAKPATIEVCGKLNLEKSYKQLRDIVR